MTSHTACSIVPLSFAELRCADRYQVVEIFAARILTGDKIENRQKVLVELVVHLDARKGVRSMVHHARAATSPVNADAEDYGVERLERLPKVQLA